MKKIVLLAFVSVLLSTVVVVRFTRQVVADGTIYIRADGSVEGTTHISSVDNVTYYFTNNINDSIVVQRDNIVVDGAGYSLQGTGSGTGIDLTGRSNVTIKNMKIKAFWYGILLYDSSSNSISGSNITNNYAGIGLDYSSNNSIEGNSFVNNGLLMYNPYGNVVSDNLVNGKPLVYLEEVSDYVVEDAGQVILVKCNNITVENLNLSNTTVGVQLWNTNNTKTSGNNITANNYIGIWHIRSCNNSISGNNITASNAAGIYLSGASNNNISGNNITNNYVGIYPSGASNNISGNNITNNWCGIDLRGFSNNNISGNNIAANNWEGIRLSGASNNNISGNNITNNEDGIYLRLYSNNNSISGNNIANNEDGIYLIESSNNVIYHNNFINNVEQADVTPGYPGVTPNTWDDGYPSGGNYWSDYIDLDQYSGPYQNETGSDGIWDHPYVIDENNQDNYPIVARAPAIWSSDSLGNEKNTFAPLETVYATVPATGENVTFYIVADQDVWNDGDPLTDVSDGTEQLTLAPGPGTQIVQVWGPPLTSGIYDIVEDTNNNGLYDAGVDEVDSVAEVGFAIGYAPPVASFTYSPLAPYTGETIIFNASASYDHDGDILSYEWDFGDGAVTVENDPIVEHAYASAGTYPVELTVTDNDGLMGTTIEYIVASNLVWSVDDPIGDVEAGFVDIVKGSVLSNGTHLTVIIKLKELPHQLYFDDPETPDNGLEYEWSLYIDVDGDPSTGSPFKNGSEVCISIMNFKSPGIPKYGTIIDETQQNIWIYNSTTGSWHSEADVTAIEDFSTNSLIMVAPLQLIPWEDSVESSNLLFMTSYYHDGEDFAYSLIVNNPPYQPQLSITPSLTVEDADDLIVTVIGPTPADPDGDTVTYTYRWLVDVGTEEFLDDELAGRGDHTGNMVPAADTVAGDIWRVEVTPVDEHGTVGPNAIATWQVVVDATKPVADAGPDQTVVEDIVVSFDAGGSSDNVGIVSYEWDFGDGTIGTGLTVNHTYAEPGTYNVTLTVTDATGYEDTNSITITVLPTEPIREPRSVHVVAEVAVVAAAVTATTAALASFAGLGQSFNSAVSKLPIPKPLKDFLKIYGKALFKTVGKVKLEALEKAPFITRGDLATLGISVLVMTIVFGFVEANGLPRFLEPSVLAAVIPRMLLSVCMVRIVKEFSGVLCARTCGVYRQFRLWMYGLVVFLVSGLLFLFPFGTPVITRYQSGEISNKTKGLIVLSEMLVLLTLTIPFAGLSMLGFETIGDVGLLLTLMIVCYSLVPLKPLAGKAVFDYRKEISLIALALTAILFYSSTVKLLPHIIYLAAGIVSVFLAATTLSQLRKAHPK